MKIKTEVVSRPLPAVWRWAKLGNLGDFQSGGTPRRGVPEYYGGSILWAKIEDLTKAGKWIDKTEETITEKALQETSACIFPTDTVLFAMYGSIGTCSIVRTPLTTNQAILGCQCSPELHPEFLYYWFSSQKKVFLKLGRGGTQANLNAEMVQSFQIPLPSLSQQQEIVSALNNQMVEAQRLRLAAERQLEATQLAFNACIRETFNDKAVTSSQEHPMGAICDIVARQVTPTGDDYKNLPHVSSEHIESITARLLPLRSAKEDNVVSGNYLFSPGEVLYSKIRPYLRKVAMVDFRGVCSADIYPLRPNTERVHPRWLMWLLVSEPFTNYAIGESKRTRMPKLNRDQLFRWSFHLPDIDTQTRLVRKLDSQVAELSHIRQVAGKQLEATNALPQAILKETFGGLTPPAED